MITELINAHLFIAHSLQTRLPQRRLNNEKINEIVIIIYLSCEAPKQATEVLMAVTAVSFEVTEIGRV